MLITLLSSGIMIGCLYALMALALSLTYRSSEITNFAQGDAATLSVYLLFLLAISWQWPLYLALPLILGFAFGLAGLTERLLALIPSPNHFKRVILTLGLQIFFFGIITSIWGSEQQSLNIFPSQKLFSLGQWQLNSRDLISLSVALLLMLGIGIGLRYSRLGLMIQASQQNPSAARLLGISVSKMRGLSFGISGIIGAIAALLISPIVSLDPSMMWEPLLKGFAAAVLGGMRSLKGAILGGLVLGIAESFFGYYISLPYKSLLALALITLVLWLRPRGLGEAKPQIKL
ncbi:MAG: branched-chain amino acid ABC transporter permease [Bacteroidota bacterium]